MKELTAAIAVVLFLILLLGAGLWGCPQYRVYSQTQKGRAALQEAEYTRQIARLDAEAQIELATGEAEANEILVEGLGGPDNYLKWLYIQMLDNTQGDKQVIYVPQSEFLPIGEAGRSVSRPIPAE